MRRRHNAWHNQSYVTSPMDTLFNGSTAPPVLSAFFLTFLISSLLLVVAGAVVLLSPLRGKDDDEDGEGKSERRRRIIIGADLLCSGVMALGVCLAVAWLTPSKRMRIFRLLGGGSGGSGGCGCGGGGDGGDDTDGSEEAPKRRRHRHRAANDAWRGGAFVAELVDNQRGAFLVPFSTADSCYYSTTFWKDRLD
jgi:MFS family permease